MKNNRNIFLLIFFLSGFSGLIYESIWSHYLKLFLGHTAYAQTLVLMIFMGGMAIGSWLCSRMSMKLQNLLLVYAIVEGLIGAFAIVFHPVFTSVTELSFEIVFPYLSSPSVIYPYKWLISGLMVMPQSILLGMTFPLMCGGVIRRFPSQTGSNIALLYFTNSLGGAAGVLVSGFITIKLLGLNGTITLAGILNLMLALWVWLLFKDAPKHSAIFQTFDTNSEVVTAGYKFLLFIAFLTGLASFVYEISWIRMLSLVLGSSTHSFELMLSAFVIGLSCGGFWVHRRIDKFANSIRSLATIQIIMGSVALATLPLYGQTFNIMRWLISTLNQDEMGYLFFNLASHGIAMLVMFPAAFCAGMTLPLITHHLISSGQGERSIGAVYGVNTLGAIAGTFIAVHFGLPFLGLKGSIVFAAAIDIGVGAYLFLRLWSSVSRWEKSFLLPAGFLAILVAAFFVQLDPYKMASGVYREGDILLPGSNEIITNADGKTATISVTTTGKGTHYSIRTNGKSDAQINMSNQGLPSIDEVTQTLIAAIPSVLRPEAVSVANIGFGSGMTSHVMLASKKLEVLDTIEIDPKIVESAKILRPFNARVYDDPRSRIHIEDAKTFFSANQNSYDLILSEPSNPWVSGVAGLFSKEFYHTISRHLNDNGLLAQWLHLYEFDMSLLFSILKAIIQEFDYISLYSLHVGDILILASNDPINEIPVSQSLTNFDLHNDLSRIGVNHVEDLRMRWIGDKDFLIPLIKADDTPVNSDFRPYIDQYAVKARFLGSNAFEIYLPSIGLLPILKFLTNQRDSISATQVSPTELAGISRGAIEAAYILKRLEAQEVEPYMSLPKKVLDTNYLDEILYDCRAMPRHNDNNFARNLLALKVLPYLTTGELERFWLKLETMPCGRNLNPHELQWVELYKSIGRKDEESMELLSIALLNQPQFLSEGRANYLLGIGMISLLV